MVSVESVWNGRSVWGGQCGAVNHCGEAASVGRSVLGGQPLLKSVGAVPAPLYTIWAMTAPPHTIT